MSTRKEGSRLEALEGRLTTARALTDNARACGAKVFVEGPELILGPTRHVEEDLVILHSGQWTIRRPSLTNLLVGHRRWPAEAG
ncbi:hypothetical protein [Nocardia fusca]|uniref:hypothetical protein n=1 Tax=Nocardia fusca TaxID=941183 RepID=UPI0012F4B6B6|nr:hypothetical protein [Nocardia fusca]